MNYQMIVSYLGKAALFLAPILVAKGILSQEQVNIIMAVIDKIPELAIQIGALATSALSLYSLILSWKTHKAQ